ncbi:MAG: YbhB/YbcL family Raf kinase inhibitor-like protein [Pseudolabrys sp.]
MRRRRTPAAFIVVCDDPDAPGGTWHHWAAYDIPAELTTLAEGAGQRAGQQKCKQAINDFQRADYGGPCPPHLHGLHHYHFRLLALSVDHLKTGKDPSCREIEREARKHVIAEATLIGVYER